MQVSLPSVGKVWLVRRGEVGGRELDLTELDWVEDRSVAIRDFLRTKLRERIGMEFF